MITNGAITPAEVRPLLAQATAASLDEIQAALLDAAVGATRENWTTFTCPDCGKKHRAQVQIPDVRARVGAIEVLLREGLGRPAQAEENRGTEVARERQRSRSDVLGRHPPALFGSGPFVGCFGLRVEGLKDKVD